MYSMSTDILITRQNADGGWPYVRGNSRTEATIYAVLALLAAGEKEASERGLAWLRKTQRRDGGWAAQVGVDESNWTTSLAALLPREALGPQRHAAAIAWLMGTTGRESTFEFRLRQWLLGNDSRIQVVAGWPWIPGAGAWVGPTSIAILALEKELRRRPLVGIRERVETGRTFLLQRACHDGGWNHGSVRTLGYESNAYPETTGMALAALSGTRAPEIDLAVTVAREFLKQCHSADAQNWLRFGLMAHGALPPAYCKPQEIYCRTIPETSLDLLANDAAAGRRFFWC